MDLQGTNSRRGCLGLCANMLTTNIGSEKMLRQVSLRKTSWSINRERVILMMLAQTHRRLTGALWGLQPETCHLIGWLTAGTPVKVC